MSVYIYFGEFVGSGVGRGEYVLDSARIVTWLFSRHASSTTPRNTIGSSWLNWDCYCVFCRLRLRLLRLRGLSRRLQWPLLRWLLPVRRLLLRLPAAATTSERERPAATTGGWPFLNLAVLFSFWWGRDVSHPTSHSLKLREKHLINIPLVCSKFNTFSKK